MPIRDVPLRDVPLRDVPPFYDTSIDASRLYRRISTADAARIRMAVLGDPVHLDATVASWCT